MHALHAQESVGHGATGIARCGHQYVNQLFLLLVEVTQQAGHEACAYILERKCRTVEKLQRVDILINLDYRCGECQCVIDNLGEVIGRDILAKECLGNLK